MSHWSVLLSALCILLFIHSVLASITIQNDNTEGPNMGPWCIPWVIWPLSENDHIKGRIFPLCATCWGNYSGDQTPHTSVYVLGCVYGRGCWTDVFYSLINIRKSYSDWRSWTKGALFLIGCGLSPFTHTLSHTLTSLKGSHLHCQLATG